MTNESIKELEVLQPSAVESITRAEIDVAIATAHRFPRELAKVKQSMLGFATLDQETSESCFYSLPRGGKNIQGPSVRLAEIAVSCYGNLQAGSRIISVVAHGEQPHVVVQAIAKDLEKNITISVEKRRRIIKKRSKDTIDEDDINLAANACSAICFRDAVFKVVPLALIKPVFEAARKVAIGDARTLNDRRARCLDTFAKMGVGKDRVLAKMECKTIEDIGLEHLETLIGLHNAIKEGEVNIDEAFTLASSATSQAPRPETIGPGFAPQTNTPVPTPAPVPAPMTPKNVVPMKEDAKTPAPAAEAPRPRGRPRKIESTKFSPKEAAEIVKTGQPVAPSAVEYPEGTGPDDYDDNGDLKQTQQEIPTPAAEEPPETDSGLSEMGLAPEEPEPAKDDPDDRQKTQFKPIPGEPESLTNLRKAMHDKGVTEDQLFKFLDANPGITRGEKQLTDFVSNSRTVKLVQLTTAFNNPVFLEKIAQFKGE